MSPYCRRYSAGLLPSHALPSTPDRAAEMSGDEVSRSCEDERDNPREHGANKTHSGHSTRGPWGGRGLARRQDPSPFERKRLTGNLGRDRCPRRPSANKWRRQRQWARLLKLRHARHGLVLARYIQCVRYHQVQTRTHRRAPGPSWG